MCHGLRAREHSAEMRDRLKPAPRITDSRPVFESRPASRELGLKVNCLSDASAAA